MVSLFRRPTDDLELLRDAVASLGSTSVPGLAAALSWRERRTERALLEELSRPGTPLTYDPALRSVRWAPRPIETNAPPALPGAAAAPDSAPRAAAAAASTVTTTTPKLSCPSCHVTLVAAASGSIVVCPNCGRLTTARTRDPTAAHADRATEPASAPAQGTMPIADRRSQELFAAYVTSRPIPCPRCRTPLRHKGVSEYACPSCGETVRFASASPPGGGGAPPVTIASREAPAAAPPPRETPPPAGTASPGAPAPAAAAPIPPTTAPAGSAGTEPPASPPEGRVHTERSRASALAGAIRARFDIASTYLPPSEAGGAGGVHRPKFHRHPRARASCRVPPRFPP